jgi:RNA polymerase sigma-70 factor, ECF subfamily
VHSWSREGLGNRGALETARPEKVAMVSRVVRSASNESVLAEGFRDFFEATYPGLYGAMCIVTGNRADAEELVQDAYLKVWERWDRVRQMENPTGYLYRTAMNAFRMRYRRAAMAARRLVRDIARSPELDVFEAKFEIDQGLAQLTTRQRAAVVLTELLEMSSVEAGAALGVRPATVRKLAQQGRESLRRAIGGDGA